MRVTRSTAYLERKDWSDGCAKGLRPFKGEPYGSNK
jgi:hypothetical protein